MYKAVSHTINKSEKSMSQYFKGWKKATKRAKRTGVPKEVHSAQAQQERQRDDLVTEARFASDILQKELNKEAAKRKITNLNAKKNDIIEEAGKILSDDEFHMQQDLKRSLAIKQSLQKVRKKIVESIIKNQAK